MTERRDRIAIDVAPVREQPAGVGFYVASLVRNLTRSDLDLALIGVRPEATMLSEQTAHTPSTPFSAHTYHAWMQLAAERDARATGAALVHYTNAAAPIAARTPYVLTVHDLSVMRMPGTHPLARLPIVPVNLAAIARARTIIVPSRFTARELRRIGVDPRRVVVIPHAPAIQNETMADQSVLARYALESGRYVLYFGTLEPRKNIARVVGSFEKVVANQPDLKLVLAGGRGWRCEGIERRIADSPARERVVVTGYLPDDELATLIRGSGAVAYVSLYEGFGMPVLDAMSLGAAVVASRTTAMPEAAGGAAVLVDPRDEAQIAAGIERALAQHDELVQRGRERAQLRTWTDVAAEHISVYRRTLRNL